MSNRFHSALGKKMNIVRTVFIAQVIFIALIGCQQDRTLNWPEKVKTSLFIPQKVKSQEYYELNGTYQTMYKASMCWPGEQYIDMVVTHMSKLGWKRLDEDLLNPGLKLHWAKKGSITQKWGFYVEKGKDVYQWIEDWEDADKNLVRYGLKYKTEGKGNISITSETCDLEVAVIFIPKEIRQKALEEVEAQKKKIPK